MSYILKAYKLLGKDRKTYFLRIEGTNFFKPFYKVDKLIPWFNPGMTNEEIEITKKEVRKSLLEIEPFGSRYDLSNSFSIVMNSVSEYCGVIGQRPNGEMTMSAMLLRKMSEEDENLFEEIMDSLKVGS